LNLSALFSNFICFSLWNLLQTFRSGSLHREATSKGRYRFNVLPSSPGIHGKACEAIPSILLHLWPAFDVLNLFLGKKFGSGSLLRKLEMI
jgi:hypothetical protein